MLRVLNRRGEALKFRLTEIAHCLKRDAVGAGRIGECAAEPGIPVRIVTIIPAERGAELADRLIDLNSASNRVLLAPQQAALYIHVLEGEPIFGPHERG